MNDASARRPPRLAQALLSFVVTDNEAREGLTGDLAEEFAERHHGSVAAARRWYWRTALTLCARYGWERTRPGRSRTGIQHTQLGDSLMLALWQDVRLAFRALRRSSGFTAVAVLTLALGIGATTAMFSTLHAVLLTPLPFDKPGRLVIANTTFERQVNWTSSAQDYEDYRDQSDAFEGLGVMAGFGMPMAATGRAEGHMVDTQFVSWDLFRVLRVAPVQGRAFRPDEARLGAADVAIVSHAYWQTRLAGDPGAIGSVIVLDGTPVEVVGVMPAGFRFYYDIDVWLPYRLGGPFAGGRQFHNWVPVGRLADGVSLAQAQAQFDVISVRLQAQYPATNENKAMRLIGLHDTMVADARPTMLALAVAVALLLLIACANVANLLLVRGSSREGEMAVRLALGAGRGRLVQQLMTESLVIALLAGTVGTVLALWLQQLVFAVVLVPQLGVARVGFSWPMLGFAVTVSIATALIFGVLPAWRTARRDLSPNIGGHRRGGASVRGTRVRSGLVMAQVALSFVLLVGAGLLIRSFAALVSVDLGFDTTNLLTVEVRLPPGEYPPERRELFFNELAASVRALPGVTGVAVVNQLPVRDPGNNIYIHDVRTEPDTSGFPSTAYTRVVLPGYFETMGIPLLNGRPLRDTDSAEAPRVMVISQTMADTLFPGEPPVGQRVVIGTGGPETAYEVVGVVGDVHMSGPASAPAMSMYRAYAQTRPSTMRMAIRTSITAGAVATDVRDAIRRMDANIPIGSLDTMEAIIADSGTLVQSRVLARALGMFAALALLLAGVGLYSVLAYLVSQRRHEIGVRLALGASARTVTTLVMKRGVWLVAGGLLSGTVAAVLGAELLASQLFAVGQTDPVTYLAAAGSLLAVAVCACLIPVQRALRVDPLIALRND